MHVPNRFILQQAPVIAAMGRVALSTLRGSKSKPATLPGPERREVFPPRSADLVRHYVALVGGEPSAYAKSLPPHLFPQWGFPIAMKTLVGLDYPLSRGLNAGCRLRIARALPQGEPLEVRSRLESIDDDGRRALLEVRIITGTKSAPDALEGIMTVLVPLRGGVSSKKEKGREERPRVPADARELWSWKLGADAGFGYAKLTGDFNPLHWIPAFARASGFANCILHGFATMAFAMEGLNAHLFSGDVSRLRRFDVRFTAPLVLPAQVGLYVAGREAFVGDAPGARAYLVGSFDADG